MSVYDLSLSYVRELTPYRPGKPISELERELGLKDVVKLASNENPLGPSPFGLKAAQAAILDCQFYPDGGGFALKQTLSEMLQVDALQITLGNGSNDVLELIARTFLAPGLSAAYCEHAFAVYPIVTQAVGASARIAPAHDGSRGIRYAHDLEALGLVIDGTTRVVFIANPNNPTGTHFSAAAFETFIQQVPATTIIVLDEAYFEYVREPDYPDGLQWLSKYPNLIVTRTFSKAYGLAGLRVGYAVSSPEIADLLNRVRQPFNVNLPALEAAKAALHDRTHLEKTVMLNIKGLQFLRSELEARGFEVIPSVGNFLSFDLGRLAQPVYEALLREGVIVRPIANYGLLNHLRVTVGLERENQSFLAALDRVITA